MKKIIIFLVLIISVSVFSQDNKSSFWQNVRFGGGLGLGFGSTTTVSVSPTAVYDFPGGFSLGAGLNYTYLESGANNTANVYGGSILSMFNIPVVNLQLSGEYEHSFISQKISNISNNRDVPALYMGIAYRSRFASFGIRYDVLHDDAKSIYSSPISPIIRVFF